MTHTPAPMPDNDSGGSGGGGAQSAPPKPLTFMGREVVTETVPRTGWPIPRVQRGPHPGDFELWYPQEFHRVGVRVRGDEIFGAKTEYCRWVPTAAAAHAIRSLAFTGTVRRVPPRPWLAVAWAAALCTNFRTQATIRGVQRTASIGGPFSPSFG